MGRFPVYFRYCEKETGRTLVSGLVISASSI